MTILTPPGAATPAAVGLYATFHDEDDTAQSAAPALGPFDELTIRSTRVVGERAEVGTVIAAHGANGRWRAADPELQRALAAAGGDASRGHIRAHTENRDMYVRAFDDDPEHSAALGELGPFSSVDIGTHALRADRLIVAVRVSSMAPWLLTDNAAAELGGVAKRVLTLRVGSARPAASVESTGVRASSPAASEAAEPFVWVERVRPVPEIYISRPGVSRGH